MTAAFLQAVLPAIGLIFGVVCLIGSFAEPTERRPQWAIASALFFLVAK